MAIDFSLFAQQDPQFTQYYLNPLVTNPAYAGTRDALSINLLAREQWIGLDGRPRTQSVSVHGPLSESNLAIGLTAIADQHGPISSTYLNGDIAYRFKTSENSKLSLGLRGGFHFYRANLSELETQEDISFARNLSAKALPNFGFSAYWYSNNQFVSLSAPRLIENSYSSVETTLEIPLEKRHFFLAIGKVFDLSSVLKLRPTLQFKYVDAAPLSADLSLNLLIQEKFWIGSFVRIRDAAGLMVSYQLNDHLRFGYSYDKTISGLASFTSGSHEILINYDVKLGIEKALSPRFF